MLEKMGHNALKSVAVKNEKATALPQIKVFKV